MMRIQGWVSSCVAAGVAAMVLVFALHVLAPFIGAAETIALYWAMGTVVYATLIGNTPRTRFRNFAVASFGVACVLLVAHGSGSGLAELAIGFSLVLSLVRTGLDARRRGARCFVYEALLGVLALLFASWLYSPGWLGWAMALWGYGLVQSVFWLLPFAAQGDGKTEGIDPFDQAHARLRALLEGP